GPWIGLELQVPMEPDHSTLGAIRLQSPTSAESREAALAELQAWLKAQLSLPPARRALSWAELHQVIDHAAPLLGWQPAPADQLNWCLLQACNAHQVQPLLEGLKTLDPALVGTD